MPNEAATNQPTQVRRSCRWSAIGWVVLGILLATGAVAAQRSFRAAPSEPTWGTPIALERFDDASWRSRWQSDGDANWEVRDGRLVSTAANRALLIYRQRLTPPVAIEYTGQIQPGSRACDLSVWWTEREGVLADPAKFEVGARSWQVQAGAFENQFCAIFRNPGEQRMAYNPVRLVPGRDYRFRVVIEGEEISMAIDGVEIMRYRDRFPTTSGYLALYGYFPGKAFDDVTLWRKNRTGLVPATAMGDALLGFGHFNDAAASYARVAEAGGAESQQALFRKGLAERRAGRSDLSRETWSTLTDPDLSQAADALRLEDLFNTGQHELFLERLVTIWQRHPAGHDDLRQQWQQAVTRLVAIPTTEPKILERYLSTRDQLFRDDPISAYEMTSGFLLLERFDDILRSYPNERKAYASALLCLGRLDEAERLPWLTPANRISIRFIRGDYAGVLQETDAYPSQRAVILCKMSRASEVNWADGRFHPAMLHLGRASELLVFRPLSAGFARDALLAAGRWEEAAGPGLPDIPGSGNDWRALAMLGRIDEAERAYDRPLPWERLMRAYETGDKQAIAVLRPTITWPRNLATNSFWFAGLAIAPMIDRLSGERSALETSLRRAVKEWGQVFGKRAWFLARAALGEATDEEVLNMPARSEAQAWLSLGQALRQEMADRPAEALLHYKAFKALPLQARLLDNNTFDTQVEDFVQWRLRALDR